MNRSAERRAPPLALPSPGEALVVLALLAAPWHDPSRLPAEEQAHAATIAHGAARQAFLAGRSLLRRILGEVLGPGAQAAPVIVDPGGKPRLDTAIGLPLDFNLSHAGSHVGLALAMNAAIGLDIEDAPPPDFEAVAAVIMGEHEHAAFLAIAPDARPAAFLRAWTRKEALLKAAGTGFATDPRLIDARAPKVQHLDGRAYLIGDLPGASPAGAVALRADRLRVQLRRLDADGAWLD